jgi:hypothetical protein
MRNVPQNVSQTTVSAHEKMDSTLVEPHVECTSPSTSSFSSRFSPLCTLERMYSNSNLKTNKASTRAEIFEDRVKNAMDEATSDDSDETFVYESNPPDQQPKRSRHHSRTPSGASMTSVADRSVLRSIANPLDQQRTVPKTRSMKFASNTSNYGTADEDVDNRDGTIRASRQNGTTALQHHFRGQRIVTGQQVVPDDDVNTVPLSKTKSLTAVGGRGSYAARLAAQNLRHTSTMKRSDGYASLDMEAEGADDERMPLMGNGRTPRAANRSVRGPRYPRSFDPRMVRRERGGSLLARFAGCFIILVTVSILAFGVVCFLFAMSKPLTKVAIFELNSVIASEQELMFNIEIQAINPNLVPIAITELNVNMFARSKYAGTERFSIDHGKSSPEVLARTTDQASASQLMKRDVVHRRKQMVSSMGIGDIAISDPDSEKPEKPEKPGNSTTGRMLLLGAITQFDNPVSFDGSFWRHQIQFSTGSVRLSKPGNHTEDDGSERWERILKHDFDLIVRGVVKYNIPLGGRSLSVPINGNVTVPGNGVPDDDDDDDGKKKKKKPSGGESEWLIKIEGQS